MGYYTNLIQEYEESKSALQNRIQELNERITGECDKSTASMLVARRYKLYSMSWDLEKALKEIAPYAEREVEWKELTASA